MTARMLTIGLLALCGCRITAPELNKQGEFTPPIRAFQVSAYFTEDSLVIDILRDPTGANVTVRSTFTVEISKERNDFSYWEYEWSTYGRNGVGELFNIIDSEASTPAGGLVISGTGRLIEGKGRLVTMKVPRSAIGNMRAATIYLWQTHSDASSTNWCGIAQ